MKMRFDVTSSDAEKATGSSYDQPKPGVYTAVIEEVNKKQTKTAPKKDMLEVVVKITGPKFKGSKLYDNIVLSEAAIWKLDQFLQALGVASKRKRKGTLDTDEIIGTKVKIRVGSETYQDEIRARLKAYMAIGDDDDDEELDEDEDGEEIEDDEDLEDDDESDDEDEESEDEDEEEAAEADDDYEEWSLTDLRTELADRELNKKGAKPALIARLRADDAGEDLPD